MIDALERAYDRSNELAAIVGEFCGLAHILAIKRRHGMADEDIVRDLLALKLKADKALGGRE